MKTVTIFIDSDVVISSFLSQTGAAYYLLHNVKQIKAFLSNYSHKEISLVIERMGIEKEKSPVLKSTPTTLVELSESIQKIKQEYGRYVLDENDAHIVAGAVKAKATFLITYNIKDFKGDLIKDTFGCMILTPANFLQYLRSI